MPGKVAGSVLHAASQSQGRPRCDLTHWHSICHSELHKETPWLESASELYRPSYHRVSAKLSRGQRDGSLRPYFRISRPVPLRFFCVAPQLYSRGRVEPVPDPLLLKKCGSAGNRTRTSGSVARNSDHWTTEPVYFLLHNIYKFSSYLTGNTIHLSSCARKSDHWTTEAVYFLLRNVYKFSSYLTGNTIHLRPVARNSDHWTTEAVYFLLHNVYKSSLYLTGSIIHLRSVARNSDHWTTEAVYFLLHNVYKSSLYLTGSIIHLRSVARNSDR
jgi:hypothetical protein